MHKTVKAARWDIKTRSDLFTIWIRSSSMGLFADKERTRRAYETQDAIQCTRVAISDRERHNLAYERHIQATGVFRGTGPTAI